MPISRQDFFLMPIPPTPNGRLHLGHIAGPYLRMDMLGRHLRSHGHHVSVVSAVDGFDSYVLWKSVQEDRSPEAVCRDYHLQIAHDLASLDIVIDEFLDFVQGPHAQRHARNARQAVEQLVARGLTETITERVLYSRATGRYIVGAWLIGRCPRCNSEAAGYFCEACGAHFRPESMLEPRPRLGDDQLEWREIDSVFLRVPDTAQLLHDMEQAGAPPPMVKVVGRFLDEEQGLLRLTAPGEWGVGWIPDRHGWPRVLFEAGWEYALTCGDHVEARNPLVGHPMRRGGSVTTVVSFGIDNAVLLLAGAASVMSALPTFKPFDHVLTNHFYNLQGRKFSTSRLHVIWAADIVERTPTPSDAVRCFLARQSPEDETSNFDVGEFIQFVNDELADSLQRRLDEAWRTLAGCNQHPIAVTSACQGRLDAELRLLDHAFRLHAVSVRAAHAVLHHWIGTPTLDLTRIDQAYAWLKGVALLATSVMPRLAADLWSLLGHEGLPQRDDLWKASMPRFRGAPRVWFSRLSLASLRPCLPANVAVKAGEENA